jgi:MFS family permease
MMQQKKNSRFWLSLVIFSLAGQVAWVVENMYFNVFIYKMFHASAGEISLMVGASAAAATVTTLLIGALSDKLGKRKLFICGGYILWGISIWSFTLIRQDLVGSLFPMASAAAVCVTLTILLDCVMTFFGSSANDACFNAWLTDASDDTNRGRVEGINAMMPLVAILVVFGGFMGFDLNRAESWSTIFTVIGIVMVVIGVAGFFLIQEPRVQTGENQSYFGNIFYGFRPNVVRENRQLYQTLVVLALFNISIQIFMPYLILYYTVTLGIENYVLIFAPAILLAAVFTALYGRVYDSKGFIPAIVPTLVMLMVGYVGLYFVKDILPVFLVSLLMMCGYLGTGAVIGAKVRTHTPANKSGMFQGLRIFGQVLIPGIIGPGIGAWILRNADTILNDDGTTSFVPDRNIFLGALLAIAVVWPMLLVLKEKKNRK